MNIQKNVPMPTSKRSRKYPFLDMAVGDSVFFDGEEVNGKAYRAAMSTGTRHDLRFVARRENNGLRIWRAE
tara:strand:- start:107 stop:319 length:213 start_codon:yes stop_codon:yes gene_type:complete